jgi:hypothetical protein
MQLRGYPKEFSMAGGEKKSWKHAHLTKDYK